MNLRLLCRVWFSIVVMLIGVMPSNIIAQVQIPINDRVLIQNGQGLRAAPAEKEDTNDEDDQDGQGENKDVDGNEELTKRSPESGFARNADLETILLRAKEFVDSQQYVLAGPLFQKVIEDASGTLTHVGENLYLPTRYAAIRALKDMPPEAIKAYRLPVDPKASSVWKRYKASGDFSLLELMVRRYLMSSLGDQAALELASFYLDSHEYSKARRLLEDILKYHPDPDVDLGAVRIRLFVAYRKAGNEFQATALWESLPMGAVDAEVKDALAELSPAIVTEAVSEATGWTMPYGNAHRTGALPDYHFPKEKNSRMVVTSHWDLPASIPVKSQTQLSIHRAQRNNLNLPRQLLADDWQKKKYFPVNQIYRHNDRLYVASYPEAYAIDLKKESTVWSTSVPFPGTQQLHYGSVYFNRNAMSVVDRWFFMDTIGRELSFGGDTLFRIEKHLTGAALGVTRSVRIGKSTKQIPLASGNQLVAYDVKAGKELWRIGQFTKDGPQPEKKLPPVYIPPLNSITIDGKLDEWGQVVPVKFAVKKLNDSLHAELRVAWTPGGLAASFKVIDDVATESDDDNALWKADGVEFFTADEVGSKNMFQLLFAPGRDKAQGKPREQVGSHYAALRMKGGPKYQTVSRVLADGYVIECLMPWSNLTKKAKAGEEFAFQAYVNDVDGDFKKRKVYTWHPKSGTHSNTSRMMPIILDGPGVKHKGVKKPAVPVIVNKAWQVNGARFLGAPLPLGESIVVPVLQAHGVSLVSLAAATGELQWERLITSYYGTADTEAVPAAVTEHDGVVYVCVGFGVVAALDIHTGEIEWVASYSGSDNIRRQSNYIGKVNDKIVVLPNDSSSVLALDAANGRRVLESADVNDMAYVLGLDEQRVYMAGHERVLAINHGTGQTAWETALGEQSLGKGVLTATQVLIPEGNVIRIMARASGQTLSSIPVSSHLEGPVGNLHVMPDALVISDLRSVYRVQAESSILKDLAERIAAGETEALIARARINAYSNRVIDAVKDYLQVVKRNIPEEGHEPLRLELYNLLMRDVEKADSQSLVYLDKLVKTPTEKSAILFQKGKAAVAAKNHAEAYTYFSALVSMDSSLVVPVSQTKRQHVSLAALSEIHALHKNYPEAGYAVRLGDMAQGALSAMGNDTTPQQWAGLYRKFTGTQAAFISGINAAATWLANDNIAMADLMLDEMGANKAFNHQLRAQAHMMRALLMAKQGWMQDASHFRQKIEAMALDPAEVDTSAIPAVLVAFKAAVLEAQPVVTGKKTIDITQAKLKWVSSLENARMLIYHNAYNKSYQREFLSKHLLLQTISREPQWACKRLSDGKVIWSRKFQTNNNDRYFSSNSDPGLLLFSARHARKKGFKLVDMLTGKDVYHLTPKGYSMSRVPVLRRGIVMVRHANDKMGATIKAFDVLSGLHLWAVDVKLQHGNHNNRNPLTGEVEEGTESHLVAVARNGVVEFRDGLRYRRVSDSDKFTIQVSSTKGVEIISKADQSVVAAFKGYRLISPAGSHKAVVAGPKGEIAIIDAQTGAVTKAAAFGGGNHGMQGRFVDNGNLILSKYIYNKSHHIRVLNPQGKTLHEYTDISKFSRLDNQMSVQWPYAFFINRNNADLRGKPKKIYNRLEVLDLTTGKVREDLSLPRVKDFPKNQKIFPRVGHMIRKGSILFMSCNTGLVTYDLSPSQTQRAAKE